jgi:hypothetical protein
MTGLVHVGCSASIVYTWANSSGWRSMATMVELVPRQTLSSPGLEARRFGSGRGIPQRADYVAVCGAARRYPLVGTATRASRQHRDTRIGAL